MGGKTTAREYGVVCFEWDVVYVLEFYTIGFYFTLCPDQPT